MPHSPLPVRVWTHEDDLFFDYRGGSCFHFWPTPDRQAWHGVETRVDTHGGEWTRCLDNHVVDDFGQLVPVGGTA